VALEMNVPGRGRERILSLGPGDVLGWSPLLGGEAMSATATALQDSVLYTATASELRALCEADHELGYYVLREVACSLGKRLLATRLQMLDLFCPDTADL
jgi:CRP-like cAMP-binding protein